MCGRRGQRASVGSVSVQQLSRLSLSASCVLLLLPLLRVLVALTATRELVCLCNSEVRNR